MCKNAIRVLSLLTIIIVVLYFNLTNMSFGFGKEKDEAMQIIEKEDFIFELRLLSHRELSEVCQLVEINKNEYSNPETYDLAHPYYYVFGSVRYVKNNAAWVTFEIFSPNNKTVSSSEIKISAIPGNNTQKFYFLFSISYLSSDPYIKRMSKEDTILDVKIKSKFLK